ncbi:MAG: glutathione S-transferase family protein [Holosporaceae bacterium]|jgi:glutathione S-transferase|nr:glutathione S-transferase family protein [Holosporaceae bacterium]
MRRLYHYPLCAFGRQVRVYLREKTLDHEVIVDTPWERKHVFSKHHAFSDLPTFVDMDGIVLEGWYAIVEHMEQSYRANSLIGLTQKEKAEARRIIALFNEMFFADVTKNIVFEKVIKKYLEKSSPDSACIRKGVIEMKKYLDYISKLANCRNWLSGDEFSLADIVAAAHISCVDYLGAISWEDYPDVKDWYVRIKSRPSFRSILQDRIQNIAPPGYYQELDF